MWVKNLLELIVFKTFYVDILLLIQINDYITKSQMCRNGYYKSFAIDKRQIFQTVDGKIKKKIK